MAVVADDQYILEGAHWYLNTSYLFEHKWLISPLEQKTFNDMLFKSVFKDVNSGVPI